MNRRYLFLCPDRQGASGGIAVIYSVVRLLREAGYDALLLHNAPSARYPDRSEDLPTYHTFAVRRAFHRSHRLYHRLKAEWHIGQERLHGGQNPLYVPRADDVLVLPEMYLADGLLAFPEQAKIVFVQNPFTYLRARSDALARGVDPLRTVRLHLAVSDVCLDALELVDAEPVARLAVAPRLENFPFAEEKEPLITYMPRKRPEEAALIDSALRRRARLGDYVLRAIDGEGPDEVSRLMGQTRIFISLSRQESLGFPVMEAMATGAIVVGYTGLGGRAFLDEASGFPVEEGDTLGIVRQVEGVIDAYARDPSALDAIRRAASERMHRAYRKDKFREALLTTWSRLDPFLDVDR
ncbi:MAG: glycosyltransferase family 4 protein [Pseudomonadota bacterium]